MAVMIVFVYVCVCVCWEGGVYGDISECSFSEVSVFIVLGVQTLISPHLNSSRRMPSYENREIRKATCPFNQDHRFKSFSSRLFLTVNINGYI